MSAPYDGWCPSLAATMASSTDGCTPEVLSDRKPRRPGSCSLRTGWLVGWLGSVDADMRSTVSRQTLLPGLPVARPVADIVRRARLVKTGSSPGSTAHKPWSVDASHRQYDDRPPACRGL